MPDAGIAGSSNIIIRLYKPGQIVAAYSGKKHTYATAGMVAVPSDPLEYFYVTFNIPSNTISGKVTNTSGVGIGGITLNLFEADSPLETGKGWVAEAVTGSDGRYSFVGVYGDVGYYVQAKPPASYFGVFYTADPAKSQTAVTPNNNPNNIDFQLYAAGSISGAITNGAGGEVVAFLASGMASDTYTYVNKVTIGAGGAYTMPVPAGVPLVLQASKTGYFPAFYGNSDTAGYGGQAAASVTAPAQPINFTLPAAVNIGGTVTNGGGAAVNVFARTGSPPNYTYAYVNNITANSGGSYNLPILSGKDQVVVAAKTGYLSRYFGNTYERDKATAVNTGRSDVNITLQESIAMNGAITRAGGSGVVTVNIYQKNGTSYEYVNQATVNAGASATSYPAVQILKGVQQVVQAMSGGHMDRYYLSGADGVYDREKAGVVNSSGAVSGVNIKLAQAVNISGKVTNGTGSKVSVFEKKTSGVYDYINSVTINTGENYSLPILRGVEQVVMAERNNYMGTYFRVNADGTYDRDKKATALKLTASSANINIKLEPAVNISGKVLDINNGVLNGVTISAFYHGEAHEFVNEKNTGAVNTYTLAIPQNKNVMLRAEKTGYIARYYQDKLAWDNAAPLNTAAANIDFKLAPSTTISGTITIPGGGSSGVTVQAYVSESGEAKFFTEVLTNASGLYNLPVEKNRTYFIRAVKNNYFPVFYGVNGVAFGEDDRAPVNVGNDAVSGKNINLEQAGAITGVLTSAGAGLAEIIVFEKSGAELKYVNGITANAAVSWTYSLPAPVNTSRQLVVKAAKAGHLGRYYASGVAGTYELEKAEEFNLSSSPKTGVNITLQESVAMNGAITRAGGSGVVTVNIYERSGTEPKNYVYTYVNQVTVNAGTSATAYPTVQILKGLPQVAQAMSGGHMDRYYLNGADGVYDRAKATALNSASNIPSVNIVLRPAVTVSGGVSSNAGANLGGVTISAYVKNTAFEYVNEVTANAGGIYNISIPNNSSVILRAARTGYAEQWYDQKTVSSAADVLDAARSNVNFRLIPLATISGKVSAFSGGAAISGARVAFYDPNDVYVDEAFTDNLGIYTAEVPANASYYIQVTTNGSHFPQWHQNAYGYKDRAVYTVSAANITGLNFNLYTQGALAGTVKDNSGNALGGVTVSAYVQGTNYTYVNALKTGTDGVFNLAVPLGVPLVLQAVTDNQFLGFADGSWYYANTSSVVSSANAKVFNSAESNLTFVLDKSWKVTGRVALDPAASPSGARAELYNWPDSGLTWDYCGGVTLDSSGYYEITGTGNADFKAMLRVSLNNYVTLFYKDKNNVNNLVTANDRLTVPLLTTTNAGTVTLNLAGHISGVIIAAGGSGTVTINVEDLQGNYFTAVTRNGGGAYTVPNLPSGNWLVRAEQDGAVAEYFGETASTANAAQVTVTAGKTTTNINIYIAKEWTIAGKISELNNALKNIENALVQAYFVTEPNTWFWVASANTDAYGNYNLRGGYSNKQNNQTQVFLQISAAGYTEITTNPISVDVGQSYTGRDYPLEGAAYVQGTVVNAPANKTVTISAFEKGSNFVFVSEVTINGNEAYVLPIKANKDLVIRAAVSGYEDLWYDQKTSSADAAAVKQSVGVTRDNVSFDFAGHKQWLITGVITDTDNNPLGGMTVNVFVKNSNYSGPDGGSVRTGGDGKFSLQITPTGDLVLQAVTANPYIGYPTGTYYKENATGVISSADAALLPYNAGDQGLTFKIAKFWLVKGAVTPKNIEAIVDLYEYDGADIDWNKNKGWVTTNGTYEIRGTGNVTVNIRAATGNYIAAGVSQAALRPENTYTYNFNLTLGASISGWVTANGSGTVTISAQDINGKWEAFVTRDGTGAYTIPRVPAGARLVRAEQAGCVAEYYGETASTGNAVRINLTAGQTTDNINIEIGSEWRVSGYVKDNSGAFVSGAVVQVFDAVKKNGDYYLWYGAEYTNSSGYYEVTDGYNTAVVFVQVSANGYAQQFWDGKFNVEEANTFNMTPGGSVAGVDFTLSQAWKISGMVLSDASGQGLDEVDIWLVDAVNTENILARAKSNAGGYYEIVSSSALEIGINSLQLVYIKAGYVTENSAGFNKSDIALGSVYRPLDQRLKISAPPVEPLPPGKKIEDTIMSGPNPADPDEGPIHIGFILDGYYRVRTRVYSIGGELVYQDDGRFPAGYGEFVWDGSSLYGQRLPNGVYLAYVEVDTGSRKLKKVLKIAILR